MFVIGLFGTIAFGVLAAAVPSAAVLVVARAGVEFGEPQGNIRHINACVALRL